MNPQYRILGSDQRQYGPASSDEVRRWIAEGRLNAQSVVQIEGATDWQPLGAIPEFASVFTAPAPLSSYAPAKPTRTNGLAVTGFVFGLLSVLCCCFGPVVPILGLIFSSVGLVQIGRDPTQGGRTYAVLGIAFSVLALPMSCLSIFLWLSGHR